MLGTHTIVMNNLGIPENSYMLFKMFLPHLFQKYFSKSEVTYTYHLNYHQLMQ